MESRTSTTRESCEARTIPFLSGIRDYIQREARRWKFGPSGRLYAFNREVGRGMIRRGDVVSLTRGCMIWEFSKDTVPGGYGGFGCVGQLAVCRPSGAGDSASASLGFHAVKTRAVIDRGDPDAFRCGEPTTMSHDSSRADILEQLGAAGALRTVLCKIGRGTRGLDQFEGSPSGAAKKRVETFPGPMRLETTARAGAAEDRDPKGVSGCCGARNGV